MCDRGYWPENAYLKGLLFLGKLSDKRGLGFLKQLLNFYFNFHYAKEIKLKEALKIADSRKEIYLGYCSCEKVLNKKYIKKCMVIGNGIQKYVKNQMSHAKKTDKELAKKMLRNFSKLGYKHLLSNCAGQNYAICNCNKKSCVPLILKRYGVNMLKK